MSHLLAKLRECSRNIDGRARGFGAAVDVFAETSLACLELVIETKDCVDHWDTVLDGNALQRIRHRTREMLGVIGFAFENHTTGYDGIGFFLQGQFANLDWNFKRSRN